MLMLLIYVLFSLCSSASCAFSSNTDNRWDLINSDFNQGILAPWPRLGTNSYSSAAWPYTIQVSNPLSQNNRNPPSRLMDGLIGVSLANFGLGFTNLTNKHVIMPSRKEGASFQYGCAYYTTPHADTGNQFQYPISSNQLGWFDSLANNVLFLLPGGGCSSVAKAYYASLAGVSAILIADSVSNMNPIGYPALTPAGMVNSGNDDEYWMLNKINCSVLFINWIDGQRLQNYLTNSVPNLVNSLTKPPLQFWINNYGTNTQCNL
jgi:hypothetical protein